MRRITTDWDTLPKTDKRRLLATAFAVSLIAAVGLIAVGATWQRAATPETADITYLPCSAWADGAPQIPGNTMTDRCVTTAGKITTAPDAGIPRCTHDDYNDGTQDVCFTERTTDGAYLVIDHTDTVVSTGE